MLYLALAEAALLLVVVTVFAGIVRSLIRQHARREDLLLNQMCNLAGKPWQSAPANEREQQEPAEPRYWTTNPEQGI